MQKVGVIVDDEGNKICIQCVKDCLVSLCQCLRGPMWRRRAQRLLRSAEVYGV